MKIYCLIISFFVFGYLNAQQSSRIINKLDCQGYCNDKNFETCPDASGICCLPEIIVEPRFNLRQFDELVSSENDIKIRELFSKNINDIGLKNLLALKSGNLIIAAIRNNTIVFRKLRNTKKGNHYMLVLSKSLQSSKPEYWGHVTLLR